MKRFLSLILFLLFTFEVLAELKRITILHTNDFHGHIKEEANYPGAAKISAYIKLMRQSQDHVLVLDAGDSISGTPVSTLFQGTPIFEILSAMQYDAAVLGNHEFDHGYKKIEQFKNIANFPLICANAFSPDGKLIADAEYLIKDMNGFKIGIVGLLTKETPIHIIKTGNENLIFHDEIETLKNIIRKIKSSCDYIIALTHMGSKADQHLARNIQGVDLIIGGHNHQAIDPPILENGVYITQAGSYGKFIGHITLEVDSNTKRLHSFKSKLVPAIQLERVDQHVQSLVDHWESKVSDQMDVDIAYIKKDISGSDLQDLIEKALLDTYGSDLAYHNVGGVRDRLYKGVVTKRQVINILPFNNTVTHLMVKGKSFNLHFKKHSQQNLDPEKTYLLTTNSFCAGHHENFIAHQLAGQTDTTHILADVFCNYLKKHFPIINK